jgi:hypothetical protein
VSGSVDLTYLRYGGLLAAGVLAAGAYSAGALPGEDPRFGLGGLACLIGMVGLVAAWWQVGIAVRAGQVGMRWLLLTGALWALPLLVAPPLASRDVYAYACQGSLYAGGVDPYSVGVSAGGCPWSESVSKLWRNTSTPYGPLAVALSGGAARLAGFATPGEHSQLLLTVGLLRVLALLGVLLMAWFTIRLARACGMDPVSATWLGLVSPLVAVHVLSAAHHDGLLAGLVLAGLAFAAQARTRPMSVVAAFAALGLATAVKVTAVVALPFALLLLLRHERPARTATLAAIGATGAFAAASAATGLGLGWVHGLPSTGRVVQWTSVPSGVGMAAGYLVGHPAAGVAVAVARLAGLAVLVAVLAVLWLRAAAVAGDTRAVVAHCGAAFAACALLAPVFFPWYAAAPLAVLAASVADQRIRRWLAFAVVAFAFLVLPNGHGLASLTRVPGAVADVLLVAVLVWWQRRAIRDHLVAAGRIAARALDRDRSRARRVVDATR